MTLYLRPTADTFGTVSNDDLSAWINVVEDALEIHIKREEVRRGLWKEYPAKDQFNQIRIKIDRIMRTLELIDQMISGPDDGHLPESVAALKEEIISESHDIINYATFGVRQL